MNLKNGRSIENGAYAWNGTTTRVRWPVRPEVVFDQMVAPVPEIMDTSGTL
jgi:hypothetical protein